ncbi:Eco57I restriction-modification methylase domain-containing protein [Aestuariimicrobium soli]|uniref:Eco57I restriction-modification methylase domain-containing protein n=1 Tax=Aestuariimicrobium soli TaxID=2035834 RepID=UPI003EB98DBF
MASEAFVGVRVAGGLFPADALSKVAGGVMPGQGSADYHLAPGETVREAANRAWAYLTGVWATYRQAASALAESDRGTTLTRERWLLIVLRELGYGRVPGSPAGGLGAGDKPAPVSHLWEQVPVHLLGHRIELDRRSQGVAGAASSSPQSMVQELLNRSDDYLWAVLSNGLTLRLLRDSTSLVGAAYLEFDLEAIFDGDLFADFLVMFSACHQSRLEVRDPEKGMASCWLEEWRTTSLESGSRALNQLRDGVVEAITTLGTGFLAHPQNAHLRDQLAEGGLAIEDVNHGLLRVVYRLLFTFVAEDRGLLLDPSADPVAVGRFHEYFSTERLRRTARRRRGTRHADQWRALTLVWEGLGSVDGRPELGLVGIGGLFEPSAFDLFNDQALTNESLLRAVRHLSLIEEPESKQKRLVDYRNLGAEELGSIYEALLEYVPSWDAGRRQFALLSAAGNDRKSSGSYYTPTSLIDCLLDSALDPVLDRAESQADPVEALLSVTVCDPACGSGHFLVAAARRIAKRVAAHRTGDPEPPPERVREALADVVSRCIYGVDLNPLAAELAKVSLWLETLDPGRPLAFLDAQIKVGNSLMGATPALVAQGVPDEAFAALEGDDKRVVTAIKKQNKRERSGQDELFEGSPTPAGDAQYGREFDEFVRAGRATSLREAQSRAEQLKRLTDDPRLTQERFIADAWCAAFVWPKGQGDAPAVTDARLRGLRQRDPLPQETVATVQSLASEYQFFHWHLEFPHLFHPNGEIDGRSWSGGFDVVLGNPPWEQTEIETAEYVSALLPQQAVHGDPRVRDRLYMQLVGQDATLEARVNRARREMQGINHFARASGRFPLTARGRVNLYHLFAELFDHLLFGGLAGVILPSGILTDLNSAPLCSAWIESERLGTAFDFVNSDKLFKSVEKPVRFALLTIAGTNGVFPVIETTVLAVRPSEIRSRTVMTPSWLPRLVNPETGSLPLLRHSMDIEIIERVYSACTVFGDLPLETRQGFINLTADKSKLVRMEDLMQMFDGHWDGRRFVVEGGEAFSPVLEAKLFTSFDVRSRSFREIPSSVRFNRRASPNMSALDARRDPGDGIPRYWINETVTASEWTPRRGWCLVGKEITDSKTSSRASVFTVAPRMGIAYTCQMVFSETMTDRDLLATLSLLNSLAFDYFARQKISGTHLTASILRQLPLPSEAVLTLAPNGLDGATWSEWLASCAWGLSNTSTELDNAVGGSLGRVQPVIDPERRWEISREIDAAAMVLYGFGRDEVEWVLDSFDLLRAQEVRACGQFRTKNRVMELFDAIHCEEFVPTIRCLK